MTRLSHKREGMKDKVEETSRKEGKNTHKEMESMARKIGKRKSV